MENTIILCNNKDNYYFKLCDCFRSLYKKNNSFFLKLFHHFRIKTFDYFFWGDWKKKKAKKIIIFDLCYYVGLEKQILKHFPNTSIYLFIWNPVSNLIKNYIDCFYNKNNIFSTCPTDCSMYNLKFHQIPYFGKWVENFKTINNNKAFWVGANKGRFETLVLLEKCLNDLGVICDFRIVGGDFNKYYVDRPIAYYDYCEILSKSKYIIDLNQQGQSGLTLRVPESIFFGKKLITNNLLVKNYEFYNENNIFVFDKTIDIAKLKVFLDADFVEYSKDIKDNFDISNFCNKIN